MRRLLFALFLPMFCAGQEIPKFTNTIFVKGISFSQVKTALLDSAYFIDQQNEQDGTIVTKPKGICDCPNKDFNQIVYYIRVKDSTARISGRFNNNYNYHAQRGGIISNDKSEFIELVYWKSKISAYHKIFLVMDAFARSLSSQITYAKL